MGKKDGKPSTCPDCGKLFSTEYKLVVHRREVHENLKRCFCKQCGKGYKRARYVADSFCRRELVLYRVTQVMYPVIRM